MIERHRAKYWSSIIQILLDLSNLIEQITIYFIVKEKSGANQEEERLFFFVLLIIGFLSNLPSASPHLYLQTIGSISIEFGELLAYIYLLQDSIYVLIIAITLFIIELMLHSLHLFLEYYSNTEEDDVFIFGKTTCGRIKYVLIRSISYSIFNATSILFLFLNSKSRFHNKFFEILILLTFYFPSIALGPALESTTKFIYEYEQNRIPKVTIPLIWSLFCATIYYIMYCVPLSITGIVFAAQELQDIHGHSRYDLIVYVSSLAFFTIATVIFPPFMIWWWKFTFQRFRTMRIDAKARLEKSNEKYLMKNCI